MKIQDGSRRGRRFGAAAAFMSVTALLVLVVTVAPVRSDGSGGEPQEGAYGFDRPTLGRLEEAFDAYERIRTALSGDRIEGIPAEAETIAARLEQAAGEVPAGAARIRALLGAAAGAARSLGPRSEIEAARHDFGELSRYFIALAQADPRLTRGRFVFFCPMTPTFPKWFQKVDRLANPYYGSSMLTCGSPSTWEAEIPPGTVPLEEPAAPAPGHQHDPDEIAYYTCPMHPSVRAAQPGACPICGMDLEPIRRSELESGVVLVDAVRQQKIGVRIEEVRHGPLKLRIQAVGQVTYDEGRLTDISLKVGGWIEELFVSDLSRRVERNEPLFTLYSPELYAAQRDFLQLLAARGRGTGDEDALLAAARQRLLLWDMTEEQVAEIAGSGRPMLHVPILSPASGHVIAKDVVQGAFVMAGQRLYRIADLGRVWVEARVYESDLPLLKSGQRAEVRLAYLPDRLFPAAITRIYPYLEGETRTGRVRLELDNPALELKPDMYADVSLEVDLGTPLQVPASAVIYTGPRRIVMVDLGEGRFQPREIRTGRRTEDRIEVVAGLSAGERVVSSGNFLIAAESRLRSAAGYWEGTPGGEGGHAGH